MMVLAVCGGGAFTPVAGGRPADDNGDASALCAMDASEWPGTVGLIYLPPLLQGL